MPHNNYHSSFAAILLATLMLASTACSATDRTPITAAPGDTTATPGRHHGDTTATSSPPTTTNPIPETTEPDSSPGSTSTEPDPFIYQHPDLVLTNLNDRSTPLGRLCWAVWEFLRMGYVEVIGAIAAANPEQFEVADSNLNEITEGEDDPVGPVGVANEESEESIPETDTYGFLDALDSISEPQIIGVIDDQSLSEELQVFAKASLNGLKLSKNRLKLWGLLA